MGDAKASAEAGDSDYSKTNIQVEGVDEADIVKSDGEYIYLATDNRLVMARAYPPQKARILCKIELEGNINGLFCKRGQAGRPGKRVAYIRHLA